MPTEISVKDQVTFSLARQASRGGGGRLVFQGGYHPRKTKHVIRVVFQDQAMYARTSFRGAKTSKIGKKGVFLAMVINFGKRWRKIKKKTCKNAYLGSYLENTCLGCVLKILLRGWYPTWNTSAPPPWASLWLCNCSRLFLPGSKHGSVMELEWPLIYTVVGLELARFTQLKRDTRFDYFIMLVWCQDLIFHIAAGSHPVQEICMRLMHIQQLGPLYKKHQVKKIFGVIRGDRGQKVIFPKMSINHVYNIAWPWN